MMVIIAVTIVVYSWMRRRADRWRHPPEARVGRAHPDAGEVGKI